VKTKKKEKHKPTMIHKNYQLHKQNIIIPMTLFTARKTTFFLVHIPLNFLAPVVNSSCILGCSCTVVLSYCRTSNTLPYSFGQLPSAAQKHEQLNLVLDIMATYRPLSITPDKIPAFIFFCLSIQHPSTLYIALITY